MNGKQLDDVLFRLSVTKDESFEKVITILIPRLLLVLTPTNWNKVELRTKMIKIFSHINKRIKSISNIKLPCKEILRVVLGHQAEKKKSSSSSSSNNNNNNNTAIVDKDGDTVMEGEEDEEDDDDNDDDYETSNSKGGNNKNNALPPANPIRTNFGMVYMTLGIPNLSTSDQAELLPMFVAGISSSTSAVAQKYALLRLMLTILPTIEIPTEIEQRHKALGFFTDCSIDTRDFIFDFWLSVLLYKRPPLLSNSSIQRSKTLLTAGGNNVTGKTNFFRKGQIVYYKATDEACVVLSMHPDGNNPYYTVLMSNGNEKQTTSNKLSATYLPPGLSNNGKANIIGPTKKDIPQDTLNNYKFGIMKLLGASVFPPILIARHVLAGRADSSHHVIEKADEIYRRFQQGRPELEDVPLIRSLLEMVIGDLAQAKQNANEVKSAVGPTLKLKILEDLLRSRMCTEQPALCIKVAFDCLYGTGTTDKHRLAGVRLCKWCFEAASDASLNVYAPLLSSGVQKTLISLIESSKNGGSTVDSRRLREYCYSALSVLAPRRPKLFAGNLELPRMCFEGLLEDDNEFRASAQEALSSLATAYAHSPSDVLDQIMRMLLKYATSREYRARHCAVQMSTRIFPVSHVPTRYLCMLVAADSRQEVRFAANSGLSGRDYNNKSTADSTTSGSSSSKGNPWDFSQTTIDRKKLKKENFADFIEMVEYITTKNRFFQLKAREATEALKYIGKCFAVISKDKVTLITKNKVNENNERYVNAIQKYADMLNSALTTDPAVNGASVLFCQATTCVADLAEVVPETVGPTFSTEDSIRRLKSWLSNTNEELRTAAARVLKLTVRWIPDKNLLQLTDFLLTNAKDNSPSKLTAKHGSLHALGSIVVGLQTEICPRVKIVNCIIDEVKNETKKSPPVVLMAACDSIGSIGKAGCLTNAESVTTVDALIKLTKSKTEETNKLVEHAVVAIGDVCEAQQQPRQEAIDGMFKLQLNKYEEIQFAVGETLSRIGMADASMNKRKREDDNNNNNAKELRVVEDGENKADEDAKPVSIMATLLQKIMDTIKDARPVVRTSAAIWMLSIVKFGGSDNAVLKRLKDLQAAFTLLLGERSQFLQELGGKGLSYVYDLATEKQRKTLLSSLVRAFSSGKRQQVEGASVDIYGEGGPAGANLAESGAESYKQMCDAATDMGNPALIYKFLSLSSDHAQWNSRRGAAFGMVEVAGESGLEAMRAQLGTIVPRLYRNRFAPDTKTRVAMHRLWESLVGKDMKKTVDKYFGEIVKATLPALGQQKWRERQAACEALNDILSIGRKADEVLPFLNELWSSAMKVGDDIKESVALSGMKLIKSLGKLSVRLCDPKQTLKTKASKCFASLLPFFVDKGVTDACKTTRALSMHFLIKIIRAAGPLLRDHVPDVAPVLLEYLSGMESQDLVYLQFHADKMNITAEQLENLRIQAAQNGPFAEALNLCLEHVDKSGMEKLVHSLSHLIRSGTGLATRCGTANFITNLGVQKPKWLKQHAGTNLLNPLANGLNDRSTTVRRAYSRAIAHVARLSKNSAVRKLIRRITDQFNRADPSDAGDNARHTSGMVFLALAKAAPNKLKKRIGKILPLVYMARFNKNENVKKTYTEVWELVSTTTAASVREHFKEITTLMLECLDASSYETRRQGADALSEAIECADGESAGEYLETIINALTKALSGRYWDGKDAVLRAVVSVVKFCDKENKNSKKEGDNNQNGPQIDKKNLDQLIDLMLRECKRKDNDKYVRNAVDSTGKLIEALKGHDYYQRVSTIILEIEKRAREKEPVLRARTIECLGRSFPNEQFVSSQEKCGVAFMNLLSESMGAAVWRVRVSILTAVTNVLKKIHPNHSESATMLSNVTQILEIGHKDLKYHQVRGEVARALLTVAKKAEGNDQVKQMFLSQQENFRKFARVLATDTDPDTSQKSGQARDLFGKIYGF